MFGWCCLLVVWLVSGATGDNEGWPFYPVVFPLESGSSLRLPVVESATYSNDRLMPPGCSCRKTGDTDDECELFECGCICDLTAGMCDLNCCCDSECTDSQRERFEDKETCLNEGPAAGGEITKCYSTKAVDQVNHRYPLTAKGTAKSSIDRMLCVRFDNSDLRGEYYSDPGYPPSSTFDDSDGRKNFDYPFVSNTAQTSAVDQVYDTGDPIAAAFRLGENFVSAYGGSMPLPIANDASGECVETQRADFGMPRSSECHRVLDGDLSETCETLGSFRLASSLYVGTNAGATPAGASSWTQVEVRDVMWRDFGKESSSSDNEILYEYPGFNPESPDCDASYRLSNDPTVSPTTSRPTTLAPTRYPTLSPVMNATGIDDDDDGTIVRDDDDFSVPAPSFQPTLTFAPTSECETGTFRRPAAPACRNALSEISYTFVYSGESRILSAYADLVLTDVPSTATSLKQRFSVSYVSNAEVERKSDDANVVNRTRSGNPGYIFGRPVLAGKNHETYVSPRVDGLAILGASGDTSCEGSGATRVVVPFGSDTISGCILRLNRTGFRDFCQGRGPHVVDDALPRYFNVSSSLVFHADRTDLADDVVGIFGNADPLDSTQWIDIDVKAASAGDAASWDELRGTCTHAITSVNYRFLWAFVGAHTNPQPKIIAARIEFGTEDLVFHSDGTSAAREESFPLQTTVTFKQRTKGYDHYTPPSPPVAVSVPYDLWYPFKIESAGSHTYPTFAIRLVALFSFIVLLVAR